MPGKHASKSSKPKPIKPIKKPNVSTKKIGMKSGY